MILRRVAVLLTVVGSATSFAETPTWSGGVAKIVYDNCTVCHRADGAGPFALASYDDVRQRAKMIADVTATKYMPPWKADRGELKFTNERGLSDSEIVALKAWAEAGAPEGDATAAPAPPVFASEWHNGPPDILLEMEQDFPIPADGPDVYRNFVVRIPDLPPGKYLKGLDYKPRATQSAHHTLYSLDATGDMRARAAASPRPGFSGMEASLSTKRVGGWAVGAQPELFPEGIALAIDNGTDLVLNAHFHPSGKPETERARIALYLTDQPPTRKMIALDIPFGFGITSNMRIPAGEPHYVLDSSFTLPEAAELSGLAPHAHLLAKEISATATLPGGKELALIHVRDWDFNWQEQYRYAQGVKLPAGTRLDVHFVYDNTAANPNNPHQPPKDVTWGPETTDEMASVTMRLLTDSDEHLAAIREGYGDWVKDSITKTDIGLVEHAVRRQQRGEMDLNGDGRMSWDERWASVKHFVGLISGSPHDELHLVPFIAWYIVKTRVLPAIVIITLLVVAAVRVIKFARRRRNNHAVNA